VKFFEYVNIINRYKYFVIVHKLLCCDLRRAALAFYDKEMSVNKTNEKPSTLLLLRFNFGMVIWYKNFMPKLNLHHVSYTHYKRRARIYLFQERTLHISCNAFTICFVYAFISYLFLKSGKEKIAS
jgi:hypothetical protein